jgi:hypothetical protein
MFRFLFMAGSYQPLRSHMLRACEYQLPGLRVPVREPGHGRG